VAGAKPPTVSTPPEAQELEALLLWSEGYNRTFWSSKKACAAATGDHDERRGSCGTAQVKFETAFCEYHAEVFDSCDVYATCYGERTSTKAKVEQQVRADEASRKRQYTSAKHIQCFVRVLNSSSNEQGALLRTCTQGFDVDTSMLDIYYPSTPAEEPCDVAPVAEPPCTPDFVSSHYTTKQWYGRASANKCNECPHLANTTIIRGPVNLLPVEFKQRCPHKEGWTYVLDYSDDRKQNDVPDEISMIAAGFANSNAFYIGNDKLGELNIKAAQMCALASSVRLEDGACQWSCIDIPDVEGWDLPPCHKCDGLGSDLKRFIALLSGQALGQEKSLNDLPESAFQGSGSNQFWNGPVYHEKGYRGLRMPHGNDQQQSSWNFEGCGISLWIKSRGFEEVGVFPCGKKFFPYVDTFQVRVKLDG